MDFDRDGRTDFVTATYDGSPYVALGIEDGFAEPAMLKDKDGKRVMLTQYWDYDKSEWFGIGAEGGGHCTSAVVFDWDADGDFDLLMGDHNDGHLFLQLNEGEIHDGKAGAPAFAGVSTKVHAGGKAIELDGGIGVPRLVDWDADGRMDLIVSSFGDSFGGATGGGVFWYRNVGEAGKPEFDAPVGLLEMRPAGEGSGATHPVSGLYADPVDYDGDGKLDLVVGGYAIWSPAARELSDAEAERLKVLNLELEAANKSMNGMRDAAVEGVDYETDPDEWRKRMDAVSSSDAFKAAMDQYRELSSERDELKPGQKREPGVWLFRREE